MAIREIRTKSRVRHVEIKDKGDKVGKGKIRCKDKLSHDRGIRGCGDIALYFMGLGLDEDVGTETDQMMKHK